MTTPLVDLPPSFGMDRDRWERLRARQDGPGELRDATSVVLVRDEPGAGLEVFLLERTEDMAFAGGMWVFPGGGVDDRDRAPLPGYVDAGWSRRWDCDAGTAAALVSAAVRETFEETGVLLAGPSTTAAAGPAELARLDGARDRLAAGEADLAGVLAGAELVVRADLLRAWARWITPPVMPRCYDTRFFLAVVPPGQHPDGRTSEAVGSGWTTPAEALAGWAAGRRALLPPTWAVLGGLSEHPDTASLLAADRSTAPVTPSFREGHDLVTLAVPADALGGGA